MWKFVPKKENIVTKNWNMLYKLHFFDAFSSTFKSVIYFSKKQDWNFLKYIINSLLGILWNYTWICVLMNLDGHA
jgi:hypothetical protein